MAASNLKQLKILLWKSLLLLRRHYIVTALEILAPLLLSCITVAIIAKMPPISLRKAGRTDPETFVPVNPFEFTTSISHVLYTSKYDSGLKLIQEAAEKFAFKPQNIKIIRMNDEGEIEAYYSQHKNISSYILGVVFNKISETNPCQFDYKLKLNGYFATESKFNNFPRYDSSYKGDFTRIQLAFDTSFINLVQKEKEEYQIMVHRFPYPSYISDPYSVSVLLSQMVIFGMTVFCVVLSQRVVHEKANRAKELMKMMGMNSWIYWTGVFLSNFFMLAIVFIIMMILFLIPFKNDNRVLTFTDPSVFLVVALLYSASTILFCLAITTFINKVVPAIIVTLILWIASHQIIGSIYFLNDDNLSRLLLGQKLGICLLPSGAFQMAIKIIFEYEGIQVGSQWSNVSTTVNGISLSMVMGMMIISCFIYGIITWYVDAVWPWQYGIPQPLYFPFTKSYWLGSPKSLLHSDELSLSQAGKEYFEPDPVGKTPGIILSNLTKEFRLGFQTKTAVDNLSLNIYNGQITILLGHNGAGKTTAMNVLTGLYAPTSGTALINGHDILIDRKSALQSLGLCPQHNVLYDTLNVEEHLKFFAGIKGIDFKKLNKEATDMMKLLQLTDKRTTLAKDLSGGMKRKLCLGMAIIGGSQVLVLDEPTSGLDPEARRAVWDMLQTIRHERTILLTTHFMEEADVLGDRIAIMSEGVLQCCGSSMFLKKKFGTGYHLRIIKTEKADVARLHQFLQSFIPKAEIDSNVENEIIFSFPDMASASFGEMFKELEENKNELGIGACGVTITTMEDVFIKVGQMTNSDDKSVGEIDSEVKSSFKNSLTFNKLTGLQLVVQQFKGLMLKRFHNAKRYWSLLVLQIVIPFLILFLFLRFNFITSSGSSEPALKLNLKSIYGKSYGFYNISSQGFLTHYEKLLVEQDVHAKHENNITEAILSIGENDLQKYLTKYLISGSYSDEGYEAWYSGTAYHAAAISVNLMTTSILRNVTENDKAAITTTISPFPSQHYFSSGSAPNALSITLFPLCYLFLVSSFIIFPIQERVSKAKLLQYMTNVSVGLYSFSNFLWDILVNTLCILVLLIPFAIMDRNHILTGSSESMGTLILLFLLNAWASIPLMYLISFLPKTTASGFAFATIFNLITGMIAPIIMTSLKGVILFSKYKGATWFLYIFPSFSLTMGFSNLNSISFNNAKCNLLSEEDLKIACAETFSDFRQCCKDKCGEYCFKWQNPLSMDMDSCGQELLMMFFCGFVYYSLFLFIESSFMQYVYKFKEMNIVKMRNKFSVNNMSIKGLQDDQDVINERAHVEDMYLCNQMDYEAMTVLNLKKVFGIFGKVHCAVDNLTFSVHKEECFGLLGINGAGKTTTFRMLTGDEFPTSGDAFINSYSVYKHLRKFQSYIGYCPQFDALLDNMTSREMLFLFARLRGMPESLIGKCVESFIKMVDLESNADKKTSVYSGGNKRKLSVALALIGCPSVVFLDEPSSGVDPSTRRKIWNALILTREVTRAAIILTTHSMEECETLCNRLAIMVNGQFRCIGPTQHLKSKFGQGYTLIIKISNAMSFNSEYVNSVKNYIDQIFPQSVLKEIHQETLHYHITDASLSWSYMFNCMETAKSTLQLEDYFISDTTLEQIFIAFAKAQRPQNI